MDAWGIDLRWVLVPAATTDVSFMHDWGFATNLADLRLATTFQRLIRAATGSGHDRTALVGWSKGATLAYAYASFETQLPPAGRNVDALVPADGLIHYAPRDDAFRLGLCEAYQLDKADHDAGTSANSFAFFVEVGRAALTDPDRPSELIPEFTNRQVALLVGASVNGVFNAGFHFVTARFDATDVPIGLRYTPDLRWLRLMTQVAGWESLGDFIDGNALYCGDIEVPFDDHLRDIRVPVLYLAAAGGFSTTGLYSTTLLGSRDVTQVVIRLRPRGQEVDDFGHVDLWHASNAATLAWDPLAQWLRRH
jgi:thioesterase domain-containing protein